MNENGVIRFMGATGEEAGGYICTATNPMGSVTATATLTIQGTVCFFIVVHLIYVVHPGVEEMLKN